MYKTVKYLPVGDRALLVEFGNSIDPRINRKVHALNHEMTRLQLSGVLECVPTYRSLLVYFDPLKTNYKQLVFKLRNTESKLQELEAPFSGRVIEIPVIYGGNYGPDLGHVAECHGISEDKVIQIHSERTYTVYMIGFVAGFPYLGTVADEIATPRLETPRLRVPTGSVGIAEKQTGIYPCEAPGGWQIIGRTPLKLFYPQREPPALVEAGDSVKFNPIDASDIESYSEID